MKKYVQYFSVKVMLLSLAATSFFSPAAFAQDGKVTSLLYVCGMKFKATGKSASIVLGYTHLRGEGKISCYDILTGETQEIPTKVTIKGPAVGVSYQNLVFSADVSGIGLSKGPESLLGKYLSIRSSAAVGVGIGITKSVRVAKDAVVLDVGIEGLRGVGLQADLLQIELEALPEAATETAAAPAAKPVEVVRAMPVEVIYVQENQPVQIVDAQGKVLKVISVRIEK